MPKVENVIRVTTTLKEFLRKNISKSSALNLAPKYFADSTVYVLSLPVQSTGLDRISAWIFNRRIIIAEIRHIYATEGTIYIDLYEDEYLTFLSEVAQQYEEINPSVTINIEVVKYKKKATD